MQHYLPNPCFWVLSVRCAYELQGQKCMALLREAAKMTHGDDPKQLYNPLEPLVSAVAF